MSRIVFYSKSDMGSVLLKYLALFFCLLFAGNNVLAADEISEEVYPLPITEMADLLENWLVKSGFTVTHVNDKTGAIKLTGVKSTHNCYMDLKPHSPLATSIKLNYTIQEIPDSDKIKTLIDYIESYLAGTPSKPNVAPEIPETGQSDHYTAGSHSNHNSNQEIPTLVLDNIESVVCIKAVTKKKNIQFSGFVVDPEGLIICTAHDMQDYKDITVVLFDGREVKGQVIKMDIKRDLVLMKVDSDMSSFISLPEGRNVLGMGEMLYSVGCPLSLRGTVNSGSINGPPRKTGDLFLWQVNMKIYPGSSGGPVFDANGKIVAVVKGRFKGTDSIGFLIPFETIMEFINLN
jgi:serine protease Do